MSVPAAGPKPSTLDSLARGSTIALAGLLANAVLGFALVVIVTRGLGADGAGVFFELVAFFSIVTALAELGAGPGLVRGISRARAGGERYEVPSLLHVAAWPVVFTSCLAAGATLLLAPAITTLLDLPPEARASVRILAPFIPLGVLTAVALAATRGYGRVGPYVRVELLTKPVLRPILVGLAIGLGFGPLAVVLAWVLPTALALPFAAVAAMAIVRQAPGPAPQEVEPIRQTARRFWAFAAPRGVATFMGICLVWVDVILVGVLTSHGEAGIYAAVARLVYVGVLALEAMRLVLAPHFSGHLAKGLHSGAEQLYRVGTWWVIAVSWPFYLVVAVWAPTILSIFGSEFTAGQHALFVLAMFMMVDVAVGNVNVVLLMAGKSVWNLVNTTAAVATIVALNLILVPKLGIVGAGVAWGAAMLVNNIVPLVQIKRSIGMTPLGSGFFIAAGTALACFGGIGLAARSLFGEGVVQMAASTMLALGIYACVMYRLRSKLHLGLLTTAVGGWMAKMRGKSSTASDAPSRSGEAVLQADQ